nr:interleukin-17D isoform X2 [Pan paniscus]
MLVAGFLLALPPSWAAGAPRAGRRPARPRGCADRPEELLEQLYGRLAAGVLSAFHHTLQLGPREQARNASCPAGGRPADRRFRPPTNLRSVSPWAYSLAPSGSSSGLTQPPQASALRGLRMHPVSTISLLPGKSVYSALLCLYLFSLHVPPETIILFNHHLSVDNLKLCLQPRVPSAAPAHLPPHSLRDLSKIPSEGHSFSLYFLVVTVP